MSGIGSRAKRKASRKLLRHPPYTPKPKQKYLETIGNPKSFIVSCLLLACVTVALANLLW